MKSKFQKRKTKFLYEELIKPKLEKKLLSRLIDHGNLVTFVDFWIKYCNYNEKLKN